MIGHPDRGAPISMARQMEELRASAENPNAYLGIGNPLAGLYWSCSVPGPASFAALRGPGVAFDKGGSLVVSRKIDCPQLSATERKVLEAARLEPIIVTVKEAGGVEYSCGDQICAPGAITKLVERGLLIGRKDGLFDDYPQSFIVSEPKPPRPTEAASFVSKSKEDYRMKTTGKPNGITGNSAAAPGTETTPPLSEAYIAATGLPNIDGRPSVLTEIPKDAFVEGREDFPVSQTARASGVPFTHPKDWVMVHPDPDRCKFLTCIKDKQARKIRPIHPALVKRFPRLQRASRIYEVRQAVDLEGNWFLWPAPSFNEREFPGDDKHREAMATAREDWVKMEWVDAKGDWEVYDTSPKFVWDHPQWEEAEEFEPFLNRGLLPLFLHTGEEPFLKRVLGQKR